MDDVTTVWIDDDQMTKLYGFSKVTLYRMRKAKKIPFSKIGRKIFYNHRTIEMWIKKNEVTK